MPPPRRPRHSLTTPDEIAHLTLPEIRERLERNNRVLSSSLFSSPPPSTPVSPHTSGPNVNGIANAIAGPSTSRRPQANTSLGTSPTDPVRDKLLAMRESLLSREKELAATEEAGEGMLGLNIHDEDPTSPVGERRIGSSYRDEAHGPGIRTSGKRRALDTIQAAESRFAKNGLILPLNQTLALADRDFDASAAEQFGRITLTASSSPKPRKNRDPYPDHPPPAGSGGGTDEIARAAYLARLNAFMGYKGDPEMDDEEEDDEVDQMFDFDPQEGQYAGEEDRLDVPGPGKGIRERGTGEAVDEFGEDEEEWAEGNDEYAGDGSESFGAGPDRR